MSRYSICRSCGKKIMWIQMKSGKAMPCDPEPISYRTDVPGHGALILVTEDGRVANGNFDPASDTVGYRSHFATCPNANAHRKRGK